MRPENRSSHIAVLGLKETLQALDRMNRRTRKATVKELHDAAAEVRDLAQGYVNPNGLSGWKKWRGGYDASNIVAGIRLTRLTTRAYGFEYRNMIAVVNSNPAGAIWEVAGRKKKGRKPKRGRQETVRGQYFSKSRGRMLTGNIATGNLRRGGWGNGIAFIKGITGKDPGGNPSRIVWRAYDETNAGFVKRRIEQMLIREGKTTQAAIDRNPY